jgi:hypothetical protein
MERFGSEVTATIREKAGTVGLHGLTWIGTADGLQVGGIGGILNLCGDGDGDGEREGDGD